MPTYASTSTSASTSMSRHSQPPAVAVLYHCPCSPAAAYQYHPLPSLYFCEECDSVRCPDCVLEEVAAYYCPNCLFEVPQASVRAEKNRCARNCFLCPACTNTLSVLASDPPASSAFDHPSSTAASIGEPPYYLACLACRWDSKTSLGITFDKPTGLAAQLAKIEESQSQGHLEQSAPLSSRSSPSVSTSAAHEYNAIRDHLEPFLKAGIAAAARAESSSSGSSSFSALPGTSGSAHAGRVLGSGARPHPTSAIAAAAARALSHSRDTLGRDIPSSIASASRFNSLHNLALASSSSGSGSGTGGGRASKSAGHARGHPPAPVPRDELAPYASRALAAPGSGSASGSTGAKKGKSSTSTIREAHDDKHNDAASALVQADEVGRLDALRTSAHLAGLPTLEQKWASVASASSASSAPGAHREVLLARDMRPARIPLQSKRTKRCAACRHILLKPDPKAASSKFKIRIVATNYLPQIDIHRRVPPSLNSRLSAAGSAAPASSRRTGARASLAAAAAAGPPGAALAVGSAVETLIPVGSEQDQLEPLRPGRNYSYQLGFSNPLYEDIEVIVELAEPIPEDEDEDEDEDDSVEMAEGGSARDQRQEPVTAVGGTERPDPAPRRDRPSTASGSAPAPVPAPAPAPAKRHWQASMPGSCFSISALDDAWQYDVHDDDDDDDYGEAPGVSAGEDGRETGAGGSGSGSLGATGSTGAGAGVGSAGAGGRRRRRYGPGILAKRGNKTVVQLDLVVGREASGVIRVPLYVTFTYTAEEVAQSQPLRGAEQKKEEEGDAAADAAVGSKGKSMTTEVGTASNLKSFSFWTSVLLGEVVPRTFPAAGAHAAAAGTSALAVGSGGSGAGAGAASSSNAAGAAGVGAGAGIKAAQPL